MFPNFYQKERNEQHINNISILLSLNELHKTKIKTENYDSTNHMDSNYVSIHTSQKLNGEVLISFDVVSLFTNIPTDLAIQIAHRHLEADDTLEDRTNLDVNNIILLLELCLNATYLQFQQLYYQQRQGTAVGSPVSVTIANLVMEDVEERALSSFTSTAPLFWKRYVDDTCTAIHPD